MKPVSQTKFGKEEGDCFSACMASILEIPLESIPEFTEDNWIKQVNEFLQSFGLWFLWLEPDNTLRRWIKTFNGYHILGGKSPRGNYGHAVVGYAGKMVHDPHPDKSGLDGKYKELGFFIQLNSRVR